MRKTCIVFLFVLFVSSAALLPADSARDGHVAVLGHVDLGTINGTFGGEGGLTAEYGLLEHLGLGAGVTIVAGAPEVRLYFEAYAKGFLLGTPLDIFVAPMVRASVLGGFDTDAALRIGIEWQTPWKLFTGLQQELIFQFPGLDVLGGAFVGIRL